MFWVTGALSSFLDNTPTYLVFLTTAGSMGFVSGLTTALELFLQKCLQQYHVARYLWGAITYIGNAPNFMVKSISDENGVKMPRLLWVYCVVIVLCTSIPY